MLFKRPRKKGDGTMKKQPYWKEFKPKFFISLENGLSWKNIRSDLISGITVGIVALPLAMAFAIGAGMTPAAGLFTVIIAGFLTSFLGGSYYQIGGPTGAFVVIIYGIVQRQGYEGLVVSTIFAGLILLIIALTKLGSIVKYIPYPLITGFTTGIALVIFSSQIKDFFGLDIAKMPIEFIPKCAAIFSAFPTLHLATTIVAAATLGTILLVRRLVPYLPWGIVSIALITLVCFLFQVPVETIYDRYGDIPRFLPKPTIPHLSAFFSNFDQTIQDAVAIAFLAGIESLLSAMVADGLTGRSHKSNCELLAQGFANIGSVIMGGIPATGALARTAINIKSGAKSPLSGMVHAITVLVLIFFLSPLISRIPLGALSSVLMIIAWDMSEIKKFTHLFKAPKGDILVLLTTFFLTILGGLIIAIEFGTLLAAFLFIKNARDLSDVTKSSIFEADKEQPEKADPDAIDKKHVPSQVEVYEVTGLFFFGLADRLKSILSQTEKRPKVFILRLRKVPIIDATGMHALKEFFLRCKKENTTLILSGVQSQVYKSLKNFGLVELVGQEQIYNHIDPSLARAQKILESVSVSLEAVSE